MKKMLNFTVGPVMTWDEILNIGGQQVPYFRTQEFSELMKENEKLMCEFAYAPAGSRTVFLTGSGTMAMEAAVINFLTKSDKVLIINGGGFGRRFVDLCKLHRIPCDEIELNAGESLEQDKLNKYDGKRYTALLVNIHETSTGVLYDMPMIGEFCKKNGLFLIADGISSFLADELDMSATGIDVLITSSQKALACAPGISMLTLSPTALSRIDDILQRRETSDNKACTSVTMYMDVKDALLNGERGQTPFTPAVAILLQINERLKMIEARGGVDKEVERVASIATYFREKIARLPYEMIPTSPSNAITALHPANESAYDIFMRLKDEKNIWICPSGGQMRDYMFRVGHIGNISYEDIDALIEALR